MLSRIYTAGLCGIDGMIITIECSTMKRMPVFDIVGLPDASVKESKDRIRSALRQSGYEFPDGEVVINMAPADKKKEGSGYDLPLCVSLLCAGGVIPDAPVLKDSLFLGELSLGGEVRAVSGCCRGSLPHAMRDCTAYLCPMAMPPRRALSTE